MSCDRFTPAVVSPGEREQLATSLGVLLVRGRERRGWSVRQLARAAGCAHSTVCRLEAGLRRPRPVLLARLAAVLDPQQAEALAGELVRAAGASLRPDTTAGVRARQRRSRRADLRVEQARWPPGDSGHRGAAD